MLKPTVVRVSALVLAVLAIAGTAIRAQEPEPIRYVVSFPAPQTHYLTVEAVIPTGRQPRIELMMPVWTPGSYLVREYARNVEGFTARDAQGRSLPVEKTRKNRWRISSGGVPSVTVKYNVYAREMSVRTNWVEDRFALINGAPTFVTLVETRPRPHEVRLMLPADWKQTMTALPAVPGQPHYYRAPDFDTLVDSPVVAGNPAVYQFDVAGKRHYLVNVGEAGVWDGMRATRDLEKVVREALKMWRQLPYDKYLFLNMITETSGGLEHTTSTVLMTNRWSTRTQAAYLNWLSSASHEFFHAWNVKRLRPLELGPFDYENENYTESLWVAEGVTDYYGDLLLRRAGITTQSEYLQSLSGNIESLQTTPGRSVQPVDAASYDAWIKYYRPDENSANASISYYTKGHVLAFLLDAKIRRATGGSKTLDDLMRLAYQRYAGPKGYTAEDFKALVEEVAGPGVGIREWFASAVESTGELDYREALDWFGLLFREASATEARASFGANIRNDDGRIVVTQVRRGTPAEKGGINVDDEILAIGEFRVRAGQLDNRLAQYRPGDIVSILVARREELRRFDVTLGSEPPRQWSLDTRPGATAEQQAHLNAWLLAQ
jgi:predicted metalloprotease with PDZ domain